jgi:hypothetical protein
VNVVVDRLTAGDRGDKLEKMLEKKKLELSAAKAEGAINDEDLQEVL